MALYSYIRPAQKAAKSVFKCAFLVRTPTTMSQNIRSGSSQSITAKKLVYDDYGDPSNVVKLSTFNIENVVAKGQVLIRMLASPINPSDLNTIQGVYDVKPPLPSVPGNEGVGCVEKVGEGVTNLKVGDWVLPGKYSWGTWKTHALCSSDDVLKIRNDINVAAAATIMVNPCTAYRMLKDFETLEKGDTVIQNGANSAVGQAVIQLCKYHGFNSVNIVRSRDNIDDLKAFLKQLGATVVLTEEEVRSTEIFKTELKKPILALNCIGGKNATEMARHLAKRGSMVTYGGMSRQPVTIPTTAFIFKDIKLRGYWMTQWTADHASDQERMDMYEQVAKYFKDGILSAPLHKFVSIDDYQKALDEAGSSKGFQGTKYIFQFSSN